MAFSPLGDVIAAYRGTETEAGVLVTGALWSVSDGIITREFAESGKGVGNLSGIAFTPDGQFLAMSDCCPYGHVVLWRVSDGSFVREFAFNTIGGVSCLAISPDGALTASGIVVGAGTELHQVSDGTRIGGLVDGEGKTASVDFSPDGEILAAGQTLANHEVTLWKWRDATVLHRLPGHAGGVTETAFAADGRTLLSAGADNTIRFWRVSDGTLLQTYDEETTNITSLAVSKNGRFFAYGRGDGTIVVAYMPLWITDVLRTGGQTTIEWQGGSGTYQVQRRSELSAGAWQNLGEPMNATTFTDTVSGGNAFYRVQSLPK